MTNDGIFFVEATITLWEIEIITIDAILPWTIPDFPVVTNFEEVIFRKEDKNATWSG